MTAASAANGGSPSSAAAGPLRLDEPPGIGEQRGLHDLVAGQERLHEQPPAAGPRPDEPGRPHEQRHRLLGGPVARRQQLGVDVEEGDDVGPRPRGAARPPCRRRRRPSAGASSSRPSRRRPAARPPPRAPRAAGSRPGEVGERRRPAHAGTPAGRTVPQRRHTSVPSSASPTAASQRSQRASDLQLRQARMRARPGVLCTHTTVRSAVAQVGDQRRRDQRRLPRLVAAAVDDLDDRPAGALVVDRRARQPVADRGQPDDASGTATPAAPARRARRARSTTTSRACHVGLRSSCSASSCSSTTTTAARSGHGAHAATRDPMTTSTPAAAAAHSCGHTATLSPARRSRMASRRARSSDGTTTSVGPAPGGGEQHGQRRRRSAGAAASRPRRPAAAPRRRRAGSGRVAGAPGRRQPGDVGRRAGRDEERPQPPGGPADRRPPGQLDQPAVGTARADLGDRLEPVDVDGAVGRVELDDPAADAPAVQRHAHVRPEAHVQDERLGDDVVELLVEPGDVGQDPGDPGTRSPGRSRAADAPAPAQSADGRLELVEAGGVLPREAGQRRGRSGRRPRCRGRSAA